MAHSTAPSQPAVLTRRNTSAPSRRSSYKPAEPSDRGPLQLRFSQLLNDLLYRQGLPGFNGFEVAKRLRQQPIFQNVVLVAMTGYGQEADRQRSLDAGFNHHLVKPADFGNSGCASSCTRSPSCTPVTLLGRSSAHLAAFSLGNARLGRRLSARPKCPARVEGAIVSS